MYELNRARLVGIGPRGARYSDVTLDLSGLGDAVPSQNLFDAPTRRPSPFSLLLLENGGGKSVLLKLLFSVVLPGRRNTVGGASLDKFVLDGDTGHVVLEWMHVATGDRLVTAKVYQRRTRSKADTYPIVEAWYSFRPSDTLDLDTLPVIEDGRRRRLDGYREAIEEADRQVPTTELSWLGDDQGRWRSHLRERGIEPDLFDIQRRMNVDEGEAAKAFKYASSKDFVDWLLKTVTDPQDASSVAQTFSEWAENLAQRDQLLLERDFLEGVIAGLDPLADAHEARQSAARDASAAIRAAERLAAGLTARLAAEEQALRDLDEAHQDAQSAAVARDRERAATRELLNEVRRQTLLLRLRQVEQDQATTGGQLADAELELAGWETIAAVADRDQAIALAAQLAAQVTAADADAAPALARRDAAAGRLLAKYLAEAAASDAAAAAHEAEVDAARRSITAADDDRGRALGEAATARERHRAAAETIERARDRLTQAAGTGLVPPSTVPAEVPALAETARTEHEQSRTRWEERYEALTSVTGRTKAAEQALTEAADAERDAAAAAARADGDLAAVARAADRLLDSPVLLEALGAADDRADRVGGSEADVITLEALDEAADRLLGLLERDIVAHTDHLDTLRAAQKEDARVVDALGDGGLLPPRPEVERALEVLAAAGIAAHAGWHYLAEAVSAGDRADRIAAHPALADGVVVVDAAQLSAAEQALAAARLLPAAAVAVGSGAALLGLGADITRDAAADTAADAVSGPSGVFVVEPTPAMYDEDAATGRRAELLEQMTRRGAQLNEAQGQLDACQETFGDLSRWRRDHPAGHLAQLRSALEVARGRHDAARGRREERRVEHEELTAALAAAEADVTRTAVEERAAAERAAAVQALAEQVSAAVDAEDRLPELEAQVLRAEDAAEQARGRRVAAEATQAEHTRLAEQARGRAERHRAACADVPSTNGERAATVPTESLAELKAAADAAQRVYAALEVDPDLRRQADHAADRVQQLRNELAQRDPAHVAEAERLRSTPAGADRTGWSLAAGNSRRAVRELRAQAVSLTKQVGQLEHAVKTASPTEPGRHSWTTLSEEWSPTTADHGQELETRAQEESRRVQQLLDQANAKAAGLLAQRQHADDTVRGVNEALLPLTARLDTTPPASTSPTEPAEPTRAAKETVEPYSRGVAAAKQEADEAVAALRSTGAELDRARTELAAAVSEVVGFANQNRYETLTLSARRSIVDSTSELVAARAAEWAEHLTARLATVASDLENADRHRKAIVERLTALTDQALKTLRQATKLSRLPEDLAEWSGRPFLKISFSDPDRTAIALRVAEVVDRVAGDYAARGTGGKASNSRRDGMTLLLEAVHASVPKGFTVEVLKPDSVLREEWVDVVEMNDVFSGGQELTAAIVLYCTLAALRANERGRVRSRHSGVLFLDNPIGRANASYLIDLQQAVARSLGVQLIYTTGISDDRVLAAFPLWVRLRNDADLRAGLKHIQVADVVRAQLPDPYADDEVAAGQAALGTLTAARVHRRPAQSGAEPVGAS